MASRNVEIEDLDFFKNLEKLIDEIWDEVITWTPFIRDTLGKQLVESADSSAANLVEGDGRYSYREAIRFFHIARGEAREARHWLKRSKVRGLMNPDKADSFIERFNDIIPKVNSLIAIRRKWMKQVREETADYMISSNP